jgi:hypothetical protein
MIDPKMNSHKNSVTESEKMGCSRRHHFGQEYTFQVGYILKEYEVELLRFLSG